MADYYNARFSPVASVPTASSVANIAKPVSTAASVASLVVPLLGALFGSKGSSPQKAAQQTAAQNAASLASLPPEIRNLLNIQTQNAQMAQPLYQNALNATNRLLPSWARGGATTGTTAGTSTATLPAGLTLPAGGSATMTGSGSEAKSPMLSNEDSPFFGQAVDNGLVPGNSLDPNVVMILMSLLTGNPAFGALSKAIPK